MVRRPSDSEDVSHHDFVQVSAFESLRQNGFSAVRWDGLRLNLLFLQEHVGTVRRMIRILCVSGLVAFRNFVPMETFRGFPG